MKSFVGAALRAQREFALLRRRNRIDAFLASFPKTGRTWVRYLLANYFNEAFALGQTVDLWSMFAFVPNEGWDEERGLRACRFWHDERVPIVVATHRAYNRLLFRSRPIIYLVRDPRDVMVSAYHHYTRHVRRYSGSMQAFIDAPQIGLAAFARHLNGWAANLPRHPHVCVPYERLSADPAQVAGELLRFLGLQPEPVALTRALAAARFDAMRTLERTAGIPGHSYDRTDRDSSRMRRGRVGGWADELSAEEAALIERGCERLLSAEAKALLGAAGPRALGEPADVPGEARLRFV